VRQQRFGWWIGSLVLGLALLLWPAVKGTRAATQGADTLPLKLTAFAANLSNIEIGGGRAQTIQIQINRWSTDGERDKLLNVLKEKGEKQLLSTLRSLPKVGFFKTPDTIAYDLRFARVRPGEDGGQRIFLATDRYVNFWEVTNQARTLDYPFTLIEIHMNQDGQGEGKLSVATRVTMEADTLVLENYADQPVMLKQVRREK